MTEASGPHVQEQQLPRPEELRIQGANNQQAANVNSVVDKNPSQTSNENKQTSALNAANTESSSQGFGSPKTFEERLKQLYEMGNEPDRKAFLDELFQFMQRKDNPIIRIPIMADRILDLYKLFKLVIQHGGVLQVINQKLWKEIIKGLNLPESITSAAFTLRNKYVDLLYPYECEKYNYSTPIQVQLAINNNKKEGKRSNNMNSCGSGGFNVPSSENQSLANSQHSLISDPSLAQYLIYCKMINDATRNGLTQPFMQTSGQSSNSVGYHSYRQPNPITTRTSGFSYTSVSNQNNGSINEGFIGAKRSAAGGFPESSYCIDSQTSESNSDVRTAKRKYIGTQAATLNSGTDIKFCSRRNENGEMSVEFMMNIDGTEYEGVLKEKLQPKASI